MGIFLSLLMLSGVTTSAIGLIFHLFPSATSPSRKNTFVETSDSHPPLHTPLRQENLSHQKETMIV
ncbi:MAG: hypothetical protein ABG776_13885 [Cyanobacteria bacterium J06555_13]